MKDGDGGTRPARKTSTLTVVLVGIVIIQAFILSHNSVKQASMLFSDHGSSFFEQVASAAASGSRLIDPPAVTNSSASASSSSSFTYIPATTERFFMEHGMDDGINLNATPALACTVLKHQTGSKEVHDQLDRFLVELKEYNRLSDKFTATYPNLLETMRTGAGLDGATSQSDICKTLRIHPDGLDGIFSKGALSTSPTGQIEPIIPPLRHPMYCTDENPVNFISSLDYLVHDFEAICNAIKPQSRLVLVDMGASLQFYLDQKSPALFLVETFKQFGFHFDHIYAHEITPTDPKNVFSRVPEELMAAYHWINVAVSSDENSKMNPWKVLKEKYNEDDIVIVKLDIDTPAVEMPLANQLLNDVQLQKIVDHFYFEHHVTMQEMLKYWKTKVLGTVMDSLTLFHEMRERGVASHSWV